MTGTLGRLVSAHVYSKDLAIPDLTQLSRQGRLTLNRCSLGGPTGARCMTADHEAIGF